MSEPLLQVNDLQKRFGKVEALGGVDFEVYENEVVGLVGDNGAGKSTLIKCIVGVHEPDGGEIKIRGKPVNITSPKDAQSHGISTVYQDLALVDELPVSANVYLGRFPRKRLAGVVPIVDWETMNETADNIISERLDLDLDPTAQVEFLSGGERQAVAIARALVTDPDIVIMDEPTSALSKHSEKKVQELIETLQDQGMTVILISHSMEEILSLTDRLTVLHSGEDVDSIATHDTTKEEVVSMMVG